MWTERAAARGQASKKSHGHWLQADLLYGSKCKRKPEGGHLEGIHGSEWNTGSDATVG